MSNNNFILKRKRELRQSIEELNNKIHALKNPNDPIKLDYLCYRFASKEVKESDPLSKSDDNVANSQNSSQKK